VAVREHLEAEIREYRGQPFCNLAVVIWVDQSAEDEEHRSNAANRSRSRSYVLKSCSNVLISAGRSVHGCGPPSGGRGRTTSGFTPSPTNPFMSCAGATSADGTWITRSSPAPAAGCCWSSTATSRRTWWRCCLRPGIRAGYRQTFADRHYLASAG
jgi:hypothetical protein